jgi:hypothetical protein
MKVYVIKLTGEYKGKGGTWYVAKEGMGNSYTKRIKDAKKYIGEDNAAMDKCENEMVVGVENEIM